MSEHRWVVGVGGEKLRWIKFQAFIGIGISNGCLFPWLSVLGAQA